MDDIFEPTEVREVVQVLTTTRPPFSLKLINARKAKGLTLTKVGEQFGSSHTRISNWEKGIATPSLRDFVKLCLLYDVTPNDLLGF